MRFLPTSQEQNEVVQQAGESVEATRVAEDENARQIEEQFRTGERTYRKPSQARRYSAAALRAVTEVMRVTFHDLQQEIDTLSGVNEEIRKAAQKERRNSADIRARIAEYRNGKT